MGETNGEACSCFKLHCAMAARALLQAAAHAAHLAARCTASVFARHFVLSQNCWRHQPINLWSPLACMAHARAGMRAAIVPRPPLF